MPRGRRYHATVRRTVVELQQVMFIADETLRTADQQRAVAVAMTRDGGWSREETYEITDLTAEPITWEATP